MSVLGPNGRIQVGDTRSEQFSTALGYPAELVPLENPYTLRPGSVLRFRALDLADLRDPVAECWGLASPSVRVSADGW